MPVIPHFGALKPEEAAALLQGLYAINLVQLKKGVPGILGALVPGSAGPGTRRLRYIRRDPQEHWRTIREIWRYGGGDCEDLASAGAAQLTMMGIPARPVVYKVNPTLYHVVIERLSDGKLLDPSKLGGMGETRAGGVRFSRAYL